MLTLSRAFAIWMRTTWTVGLIANMLLWSCNFGQSTCWWREMYLPWRVSLVFLKSQITHVIEPREILVVFQPDFIHTNTHTHTCLGWGSLPRLPGMTPQSPRLAGACFITEWLLSFVPPSLWTFEILVFILPGSSLKEWRNLFGKCSLLFWN